MNNFRRLLRGFRGLIVEALVIFAVLFAVVALCTLRGDWIYQFSTILFFLLFSGLAFLTLLIYGIVLYCAYDRAKAKLQAIPGFSEERFERETDRAPKIKNMLLCSDAVCYYGSGKLVKVIPIKDIVWVYQEEGNGAVSGVKICTGEGERFTVPVMTKGKQTAPASRYLLRLIARKNKGVLIGYKQEYEDMFEKDMPRLLMRVSEGEIVDSGLLEQEYVQNNYYEKDFR